MNNVEFAAKSKLNNKWHLNSKEESNQAITILIMNKYYITYTSKKVTCSYNIGWVIIAEKREEIL